MVKIILENHILENNWLQQHNAYYSFGSGITSTIRCKPPTKRGCQTLDQAHPLSTGSGINRIMLGDEYIAECWSFQIYFKMSFNTVIFLDKLHPFQ